MTTSPTSDGRTSGDGARLTFGLGTVRGSTIDATWWPRSTSLMEDLPSLIVALREHGHTITRVSYNPLLWDAAPTRLFADGRTIRLGWFASIDPSLMILNSDESGRHFTVRVTPPPTDREAAS